MSTLIHNIAKGKRKALTQSYEDNKERVFYIASKIDKADATRATIWAFKNAWNDLSSTSNIKENDFTCIIVRKLANYLQRNSAKSNKREIMSTCEKLSADYSATNNAISVPSEINEKMYEAIDRISKPIEEQSKKTFVTIGISSVVVAISAVILGFLFSGSEGVPTSTTENTTPSSSSENSEPMTSAISADIDDSLTYYADINIQDHGTITVKLNQAAAPITVANFVGLAESGFYDGLTFHRIIEGFMMQGGDPEGNGLGGSKDCIYGEFAQNGFDNPLSHTRGAISMARATDPNSASSQFFIVHEDSIASLDGKYAAFGYVTEGMEIVDTICESAQPIDNNGGIATGAQPIITNIKIRTEETPSS